MRKHKSALSFQPFSYFQSSICSFACTIIIIFPQHDSHLRDSNDIFNPLSVFTASPSSTVRHSSESAFYLPSVARPFLFIVEFLLVFFHLGHVHLIRSHVASCSHLEPCTIVWSRHSSPLSLRIFCYSYWPLSHPPWSTFMDGPLPCVLTVGWNCLLRKCSMKSTTMSIWMSAYVPVPRGQYPTDCHLRTLIAKTVFARSFLSSW